MKILIFLKNFKVEKNVDKAELSVTARGVYEAKINGDRIGDFILAPGWTDYENRTQVQTYDITSNLKKENSLQIQLSNGWYMGRISTGYNCWHDGKPGVVEKRECAIIAQLTITFSDGSKNIISTDDTWKISDSELKFCDLYDGEIYDATYIPKFSDNAILADNQDTNMLIAQEGEKIIENEKLKPINIIKTPKNEIVLDFGQNLTGYINVELTAKAGDIIDISFAEILDKDGNFYNENYRSAKAQFIYTCKDGYQSHKPNLTFYGFRYIRLNKFPITPTLDMFTAIVVHSELKRTGVIKTSNEKLNQLYQNIIWSQKGNFLDVPTDCPQRDERMGWTADAQAFIKAACYNYDVRKFFNKWLNDMKTEQGENGRVSCVIPNVCDDNCCAAWSDAIVMCTWQIYLFYNDIELLKRMFPAMKKWVDYITQSTSTQYMWTGVFQFGDWLELNANYGECKGKKRDDLLATAYYAKSTELVIKIGELLNEDVAKYKELYKNIKDNFTKVFKDEFNTQTECVLALHFNLTNKTKETFNKLIELIIKNGKKIDTGFIGTQFIMHTLSNYGYADLAYDLLLREEYPSWLYAVNKGATTMWEHWDGILPNGDVWPKAMNSYNHYAFGSIADWMYEVCGGIKVDEKEPGFQNIILKPIATDKIDSFSVSLETTYGKILSEWWHENGKIRYKFNVPTKATLDLNGKVLKLEKGLYEF